VASKRRIGISQSDRKILATLEYERQFLGL
jgi:hypothetical protein